MDNRNVRVQKYRTVQVAALIVLAVAGAGSALNQVSARQQRDQYGGRRYASSPLTGTFELDQNRSDDPATVTARVARNLPTAEQARLREVVMRRLEAPDSLAIDRRGRSITIASSRSAGITFDADGREQVEQVGDGRQLRVRATLSGDRLVVSTQGDRSLDYQVTFEPLDGGRSLRVTRSIDDESLRRPIVARSIYRRTSDVAKLELYSGLRDDDRGAGGYRGNYIISDDTPLVAVLDDDLSTRQSRDGDRLSLTVRSPAQYEGATIQGRLAQVDRSGPASGRAGMSFEFDRIRLRDGRTFDFAGFLESVRTVDGETIVVSNQGRAQEETSQTNRTAARTGIGAAFGALIGAIAGGGKGAAIGAVVGAGAGAGSVFVQGRDDLELKGGTEFRLRAMARR